MGNLGDVWWWGAWRWRSPWLGRFDQPVQHRVGVDFENPSGGADPQTLSQAGQHAHDELDRGLFAMEERAMRLQKVALT